MNDLQELLERRTQLVLDLNDAYSAFRQELEPQIAEVEMLTEQIKNAVVFRGESVEYGDGKAQYRSGYQRVSWDTKALEGLALVYPEIWNLRKESTVKPTVAIGPKLEF